MLKNTVNEVKVSVCVPTYQHSKFVTKCLDGILMQQTSFPFEIIIGEDESSDGTREICMQYADAHKDKIRLILRSRKDVVYINGNPTGRYNFINTIMESKGEYIALCEGDDHWTDPLKLQKQVDFLEANKNYAGCAHYTQQVFDNGQEGKIYGKHKEKIDFYAADTIHEHSIFHTSSFMFKKSALIIPDWFWKIVSGDMALFSIIAASGPLRCIPEVMSVYQRHAGGLTALKSVNENYHNSRILLYEFLDEFHKYRYTHQINKLIDFHKKALEHSQESNSTNIVSKILNRLKRLFK
jgi:glycosyltransferase involved in cell wall biosynthesis